MVASVAVAVHDVEPRTFDRIRQIRSWLGRRGIERVTLLVIPAADLHPIGDRSPELAAWLRRRVAGGDAIAQHGLAHRATGQAPWPRSVLASWQGSGAAEFPGIDRADALRRVETGRTLLRDVELNPLGFIAPGYAYTQPLREVLAETFEWFADLRSVRIRPRRRVRSPALCLGASTPLKRALSPPIVRGAARWCGDLMRIDVHPADFELPRNVATIDGLLARARGREVVTYDQLVDGR